MKLATGFKTIWLDGREYIVVTHDYRYIVKKEYEMPQIDWSKAPEWAGAVICSDNGGGGLYFVSQFGGVSKRQEVGCKYSDSEIADMNSPHSWVLVENRPSAWNGTGLPPVGTHVEIVNDGSLRYGEGESGEVVAHVENCAVVRMSYGLGCFDSRVLRTPEQIAAEEREKEIDAMNELVGDIEKVPTWRDALYALYDAGYRKQPDHQPKEP